MSREKLPGWSYTDGTDMGADSVLLGPEAQETVRKAKSEWQKAQTAGDQPGMDYWHGVAESERKKAGYSGGANGGGYMALMSTVKEPDYGTPSSEYKAAMDKAIQALKGHQPFSYDPENDPSYQQYKDQYTRLGKQAMEDSFGHAALRTGGLGGSAAMSASQQAYNSYMQALADKIPELRQIAYQMWQDEDERMRKDIDLFDSLDQQTWGRWNNDRTFQRSAFESDRGFDYNKGLDQWNMVRQLDRDAKADEETAYQRGQDEKTWAWKEAERDYERLADKAAELAATGDFSGYAQLWGLSEQETEALVAKYAKEERLSEEQAARDLADWFAQNGDYSRLDALGVDTNYLRAMQRQALAPKSSGSGGGSSGKSGKKAGDDSISLLSDVGEDSPWSRLLSGLTGAAMSKAFGRLTQKGQEQAHSTKYEELADRIDHINPGVTQEQMQGLLEQIERELQAGTITEEEYEALGKKFGY